MISHEQLVQWVQAGESEVQEFKSSTGQRRDAARTVCAMLNHRGGRVIFGVTPDHQVVGQMVGERTIEELVQELKEIDAPFLPTCERVPLASGKDAIVVTVTHGPARPYCYKGIAYRRVGSTNAQMSREEYNRMLMERLHGENRWENQPAENWTVADLDLGEITRTIEEAIRRGRSEDPGSRDPETVLRGLGLIRNGQLLRAAIVLFGQAERVEAELPQCLLRVARFKGIDRTEFLDNRQFHGHAFNLLRVSERILRESLPVAGRILPGLFERVDDPLYPPLALRETLANAFCHRDYSIGGGSVGVAMYSDRLEITSSGPLHFGLTAEALFQPHESLPWNPLIARVFFRRGVIESWGRGTLKIAEQVTAAGLPIPEIEDVAGCVMLRFRSGGYVPSRIILSETQRVIVELLQSNRWGVPLREIVTAAGRGISAGEVKWELALLKQWGLVRSHGRGRGAYWSLISQAPARDGEGI